MPAMYKVPYDDADGGRMAAEVGNKGRLILGPWRIDLDIGSVTAGDGPSGLTPRTEQLLLLLCRHANQVVSRELMLETVWAGRVVEDAAISNCIWQIRKALGECGKDTLQTRAKRGYLLAVNDKAWRAEGAVQTAASDSPVISRQSAPDGLLTPLETLRASDTTTMPVTPKRRWASIAIDVAVLTSVFIALIGCFRSPPTAPIKLDSATELTVYIDSSKNVEWLRVPLLRAVVEAVSLRHGSVLLFERPQRRNPFAGPHLEVTVTLRNPDDARAEFTLDQGGVRLSRRFRGPTNRVASAMQSFLNDAFGPAVTTPTEAFDVLVSARVAALRHEDANALALYRRAVALNPDVAEARLGMAEILFALGQGRQALAQVDTVIAQPRLSDNDRCQLDTLLAFTAPDRVHSSACVFASSMAKLSRLEMREALRVIAAEEDRPKTATLWLRERVVAVFAHIRLQEWQQAEHEIRNAQRIAAEAGWEQARVEIGALRAQSLLRLGRTQEAVAMRLKDADAMDALGAYVSGGYFRAFAYANMPIVPGAEVSQRRSQLRQAIDRARDRGDVGNEVDLLMTLTSIDRDDAQAWSEHIARWHGLVDQAYTPREQTIAYQEIFDELRSQHKYGEALQDVAAIERTRLDRNVPWIWGMRIQAQSYFALDRIDAAVGVIDKMQKQKFDIAESGAMCHFAWIFAEARQPDRARELLKLCFSRDFDRFQQAKRRDYGLLAQARLFQLDGETKRAWPLLRPRIEALIDTPKPTRDEAESLALLARFATSMPGADIQTLWLASQTTSDIAALDGAGPGLRVGAHLLRWRLCHHEGRSDCGPVLPAWAPEDLLEARLAREASASEQAALR